MSTLVNVFFKFHVALRNAAGVDLTPYFGDGEGVVWETWERAAMGIKSSPYQVVSAMAVADEVIKGDRQDERNIFQWIVVRLNLPGNRDYDPNIPWVSKLRKDGKIVADLFTFVDDLRSTGPGDKACWQAAQRAASTLNWLGLQDAKRK
jgi:hypothetical protein